MSTSKIEAFFKARGVRPACEVCGQNTWSLTQDDAPMTVKVPTETPARLPPPPVQTNALTGGLFGSGLSALGQAGAVGTPLYPQVGTLNAYAAVCMNCGNVRLHHEIVVKGAGVGL